MANWSTPITDRNNTTESYEIEDLNRVEGNTQWLNDELNSYGYALNLVTKYDWLHNDFFNESNDSRFCDNVIQLYNIITLPEDTPAPPSTLSNIKRVLANNIEKIQLAVKITIPVVAYEANLKRAGLFYAGNEGGLL